MIQSNNIIKILLHNIMATLNKAMLSVGDTSLILNRDLTLAHLQDLQDLIKNTVFMNRKQVKLLEIVKEKVISNDFAQAKHILIRINKEG